MGCGDLIISYLGQKDIHVRSLSGTTGVIYFRKSENILRLCVLYFSCWSCVGSDSLHVLRLGACRVSTADPTVSPPVRAIPLLMTYSPRHSLAPRGPINYHISRLSSFLPYTLERIIGNGNEPPCSCQALNGEKKGRDPQTSAENKPTRPSGTVRPGMDHVSAATSLIL